MFTLSHHRDTRRANVFDVYGIEKQDLQEMRICCQVCFQDRRWLTRDIELFCRFKGFTYSLTNDGGWRSTRYVLFARGPKEQMTDLEAFLRQHPVFEEAPRSIPMTVRSY